MRRDRVPAARGPSSLDRGGLVPPPALTIAAVGDHVDIRAPGEVPGQVGVERGIRTRDDLTRLSSAGYHAFLVGERLIAQPDPGAALRELRGA